MLDIAEQKRRERERNKQYHIKHREEIHLRQAEYRRTHSDQIKARRKKHHQTNHDHCNQSHRKWLSDHKDDVIAYTKLRYQSNRESSLLCSKEWRRELKLRVLRHYSDNTLHCNKCSESRISVLTIDHVDGGGKQHRKGVRADSSHQFYSWLIREGLPGGYQVLCSNHNWKKYIESRPIPPKNLQAKIQAMQLLGGKCNICGETDIDVLTVHHIYRDGAAHRKIIGSGYRLYRAIISGDSRVDLSRLECRCFNCNDHEEWAG